MTLEKTYHPAEGLSSIYDASIAYTKMLMVAREGVLYDIIESNDDILITSRQVRHSPTNGELAFDSNIPFNLNESINIVYGTNP
jgi:hypothetical protein